MVDLLKAYEHLDRLDGLPDRRAPRHILKGMKHDRDKGVLEENEYAQERAHVIKMAREEFDARSMQCHVQPNALPLPGRSEIRARTLPPHSMATPFV